MEFLKSVFTIIFMLLCFVGVLFLAYYCTKLIARRYNPSRSMGNNIKILDRANLGQNQSLLIVKSADKVLLIGCTQHGINTLCELDETALNSLPVQENPSFAEVFKKLSHEKFGTGSRKKEGHTTDE